MTADRAVRQLIAEADGAFPAGDADRWAACFTDDARVFLLHRDPLVGRREIFEFWEASSARFDTSAWEPEIDTIARHGDHAYAFTRYTERLLDRQDGTRTLVRGRLIYWMRREDPGDWRIHLLMNSHSHPMEPIPSE